MRGLFEEMKFRQSRDRSIIARRDCSGRYCSIVRSISGGNSFSSIVSALIVFFLFLRMKVMVEGQDDHDISRAILGHFGPEVGARRILSLPFMQVLSTEALYRQRDIDVSVLSC